MVKERNNKGKLLLLSASCLMVTTCKAAFPELPGFCVSLNLDPGQSSEVADTPHPDTLLLTHLCVLASGSVVGIF